MLCLIAADPLAGRVDMHSLSDQQRMELLVEGLSEHSKKKFQNRKRDFLPVCKWKGVECNANKDIVKVDLPETLHGNVELSYLPASVVNFTAVNEDGHPFANRVGGTVEAALLPENLENLVLICQNFHGTIDWLSLPDSITIFTVPLNKFSGSCNFRELPPRMEVMNIQGNRFSGSVALDRLPDSIKEIALAFNRFCGNLNLDKLPNNLIDLNVENNKFTGEFKLLNPPASLENVFANSNKFKAKAVVKGSWRADNLYLRKCGVEEIVDERGQPHACGFAPLQSMIYDSDDEDFGSDYSDYDTD